MTMYDHVIKLLRKATTNDWMGYGPPSPPSKLPLAILEVNDVNNCNYIHY